VARLEVMASSEALAADTAEHTLESVHALMVHEVGSYDHRLAFALVGDLAVLQDGMRLVRRQEEPTVLERHCGRCIAFVRRPGEVWGCEKGICRWRGR
jgi:hypothetical protein